MKLTKDFLDKYIGGEFRGKNDYEYTHGMIDSIVYKDAEIEFEGERAAQYIDNSWYEDVTSYWHITIKDAKTFYDKDDHLVIDSKLEENSDKHEQTILILPGSSNFAWDKIKPLPALFEKTEEIIKKEHLRDDSVSMLYIANSLKIAKKFERILSKYGYQYSIEMIPTQGYAFLGTKKIYLPCFYVPSEQYEHAKQTLKKEGIDICVEK